MLLDGTYGCLSLSENTRNSNRLQISLQRQHVLLSNLKTLSVGGRGLNPRIAAQQTVALLTELNKVKPIINFYYFKANCRALYGMVFTRGRGTRPVFEHGWAAEDKKNLNYIPCLGKQAQLYYAHRFVQSHLLAIVIEQIHAIVIGFLCWSKNQSHQENQINRTGNTLFIK